MNAEGIPDKAFKPFFPKQVQGIGILSLKNLVLLSEIPGFSWETKG
ncbi:hypothetical protein LYNGBM3L_20630 [Moorena producens 3L]|uniref:Uncharacterized protein n=1 Tax=Moorena producens 3L TaxID=489825 RepID=F4XMV7_9CYAN|nr:hypothetical protein LYNGBM3L_20630 [Moorena producens 3L]